MTNKGLEETKVIFEEIKKLRRSIKKARNAEEKNLQELSEKKR